ncbi:uncharacterized protein LOC128674314 [Plodia interpunctella]|uniref:uncharacterized protein LOC128674314 n=1 Tax=Plodia interpunctella TaxID=58824 RepID=UPI002367E417|nr:uncharacterized protein LOC128674314 [Plodia interpunctella]
MYSKFPFSLENLPRQKSFGCFSLKLGAILSAIIIILYSLLSIAQCIVFVSENGDSLNLNDFWTLVAVVVMVGAVVTHAITLILSTVMAVGTLKEHAGLIRPWLVWVSIQLIVALLLFVLWSTMNVIDRFQDTPLLIYMLQFLILLVRFYMLILVGSYYKQLQEEKGEYDRLVTIMSKDNWYST